MSRCFSYPPPGYCSTRASNEALILSIKLQEEKQKAKADRKKEKSIKSSEKKKERKEKKEKRREERKSSSVVNNGKEKVNEKLLYETDKSGVEPNTKSLLQEGLTRQLESSSVTEEHGWPCAQNVSCSSDSTSNSSKRKRMSSPPNTIQSHGNVLRIRLCSSQKRDEPSTSSSKEQEKINGNLHRRTDHSTASYGVVQPCSKIVKTQSSVKQMDITVKAPQVASDFPSTSKAAIPSILRRDKAIMPSLAPVGKTVSVVKTQTAVKPMDITVKAPQCVSDFACKSNPAIPSILRQDRAVMPSLAPVVRTVSVVPEEKHERKEKLSSHEKKLRKKESKYNKLFKGWVPSSLESMLVVNDVEDDDWLFSKKGDEERTKRMKSSVVENYSGGDNLLSCASYALQPRAIYLPDVDIYALPFTVPF